MPLRITSLALLFASFITLSAHAEMSARESKRLRQGKITKNEAEHLVQNAYPGAKIKRCELRRGKNHFVWALDVVKAGSRDVSKLEVDGRSGKILTPLHR